MADSHSDFFAGWKNFAPSSVNPFRTEFNRLASHQKWGGRSDDLYRQHLSIALRKEIHLHYGADTNKLENWQLMCNNLGIEIPPESIRKCKKALKGVNVNIEDLVNQSRTKKKAETFCDFQKLKTYSLRKKKIFPLDDAKGDEYLKVLLKPFFSRN